MPISTPALHLRINKLFETNRTAGDPEVSNRAVAESLSCTLGRAVSDLEIARLRSESNHQSVENDLGQTLAAYFDAPASFLGRQWDDLAKRYDDELSVLTQIRDSGVLLLAMRDGGEISADDLKTILRQLPDESAGASCSDTSKRRQ